MGSRYRLMASMVVVALAAGLLIPVAASAERTIALSTGTIELSLAPGGTASETIKVASTGDESIQALLYSSDVVYDEQGEPTYMRPTGASGEFLQSPASWLALRAPDETKIIANTPYIELDPGDEIPVDFEMRVPRNAAPGDYNAIIFFEMFDMTDADEGAVSRVAGRLGARVVLRVIGDIVDQLEVAPFSVRSFVIGDTVPYSFRVNNEGNIDKRYTPYLVVLDGSDAERMRSEVEENAVVYAGNQREYLGGLELENARFGRFTMRVEIDYNRETGPEPGTTVPERIRVDRTFWVIPLWAAVAIVIALGIPVLWLSWRASVKSSEKKAAALRERRESRKREHEASWEQQAEE